MCLIFENDIFDYKVFWMAVGATSSSREELNLFITSVNSFYPALKYTWEISEHSLAFLDIKLSINDNGLSISVHYKPIDSHTICYIRPPVQKTKKMLFHSLNYKRHRTKKTTEFHSLSPAIHKTLQSKMSFSKTSKFSAMIPKLNTFFLYHH